MNMNLSQLIGRWVEYRDRNEATRIGKCKKVYGARAITVTMSWQGHLLHKQRVPVERITRVKIWRTWHTWNPEENLPPLK